jgi:2-keto-4-pentenoate hydratase/2-oxohepta-3-ene-1,7-dioic acid hydratase in catechol pathway
VPDPAALRIRSWVNEELRQDGTTADMIFSPERLISFASTLTALEPGDLVLTGTPAGVAAASGRFVESGDRVRIAIDQVGEVSTTFVEP